MLVAVIVLFTICWSPSLIDNVLVAFGVVERLNYGYLKHLRQAFALMSYFNSCVNPFVYAFMSKNFRATFKHALCKERKYRYNRQAASTTSMTNAPSTTFTEYRGEITCTPPSSYHLISSQTQETIDYQM